MGTVSRFFEEGEEAFAHEDELDDCPYAFDTREGADWCAGFESAAWLDQRVMDWEDEDRRLDDPRRDQARNLNHGR